MVVVGTSRLLPTVTEGGALVGVVKDRLWEEEGGRGGRREERRALL